MNIYDYIKNPLTGDKLLDYARQCVAENELLIKDIQESQWDKGEDKEGKVIGYYKYSTERISKIKGYKPNRPKLTKKRYNLDWTGDLRRTTHIKTKRLDNDIAIITDSTSKNLLPLFDTIEEYGNIRNPNTIFGYQKDNEKRIREIVLKELRIKAKKNHGVQL